jgi:hypothetical protein
MGRPTERAHLVATGSLRLEPRPKVGGPWGRVVQASGPVVWTLAGSNQAGSRYRDSGPQEIHSLSICLPTGGRFYRVGVAPKTY